MYKIGEFSVLSKTTIKTLRYYEKEGLFIPSFVDENGYRYYSKVLIQIYLLCMQDNLNMQKKKATKVRMHFLKYM